MKEAERYVVRAVQAYTDENGALDEVEWAQIFLFLTAGIVARLGDRYHGLEQVLNNTLEDMDENLAGNT